jgi:putative DNA primase/helicase
VKDATTDETIVRQWWARWPDANVGVATGAASGLVVLDVDPRNGGDESLRDLEARYGPLADTVTALTGGGGCHYYLSLPPGAAIRSRRLLPGVELKAEGGYVVAPPSLHPSGRRYEWELGHAPDELPLSPLPPWLLSEPERRRGWEWHGEPIPEGQRHNHLLSLAGRLRADGLSEEAIEAALAAENERRCAPPLPLEEVRRVAQSMSLYPPRPNRPDNGHRAEGLPAEALERQIAEMPTDYAHGRVIAEALRGRVCYVPEWGWMVWSGQRWARDEDGSRVEALAAEALRDYYIERAKAAPPQEQGNLLTQAARCLSRARVTPALAFARAWLQASPSEFDQQPLLLNTPSGIVNLADGSLSPHDPALKLTRLTGAPYDPGATCPRFCQFLREIMAGNEGLVAYLQRLLGYVLLGDNRERLFVIFWGPGANGKTTICEALACALGDYVAETPPESFMALADGGVPARNDLARLAAARLVTASEAKEGARLDGALVKRLTGRDRVAARFLFREFFEYTPQFVPVLRTNFKPRLAGDDQAAWDRVRLIPFNVRIPPQQQDKTLGEKLKQEAAGILRWLVEGCMAYLNYGLQDPPEVLEATARYRAESDNVWRFVQEETIAERGAHVQAKVLYEAYKSWAEEEGLEPVSQARFGRALSGLGFEKGRLERGVVYHGLRLRGDDDRPPAPPPSPDSPAGPADGLKGLYGLNSFPKSFPATPETAFNLAENPTDPTDPTWGASPPGGPGGEGLDAPLEADAPPPWALEVLRRELACVCCGQMAEAFTPDGEAVCLAHLAETADIGKTEAEFPDTEFPDGISGRPTSQEFPDTPEFPDKATAEFSDTEFSDRQFPDRSEFTDTPEFTDKSRADFSDASCLGCGRPLERRPRGRPVRWCSDACRKRAARRAI